MCLCHMNMVNLFLSTFFIRLLLILNIELSMVVLIFAPIFKEIFLKQVIDFFQSSEIGLSKKGENFQKIYYFIAV